MSSKRRRNDTDDEDDDSVDISAALTSKRRRSHTDEDDDDNDDDELGEFIRTSIKKRDTKAGSEVVKKAKGKGKLVKGEVGGGSFQSMGLHPPLLRSLTLQGYRIPTPIQRLSIPALLENPPRDLVGMARTGSGKSLAYLVPLVQRMGGRHSSAFGARALILLPTRELALQILKVGKELARGWSTGGGNHAGDAETDAPTKGQSLRWSLIVGGEGMDEQFEAITSNPDVIIATPGRLLHLIVEMNLDLKSVQYVVFDEADRLFEMGFETALNEILQRLPASRQTLLFSATLPKSLVEFAKAGLKEPKLVRLDAESKISTDLKMAFFSIKQAEKDACLLSLLRDVIKVPFAQASAPEEAETSKGARKKLKASEQITAPHQTLIFAATKHHVEYLQNMLTTANYAVSHIYGSLDQTARSFQMDQFRRGATSILVVTDVAARGIDIPVLENVINYDFPQGARVFVHRVGRTARAGRQGWAWSFVTNTELPYLLDLQLFLGRPLQPTVASDDDQEYTQALILGTFEREKIDTEVEYLRSLDDTNHSLPTLRAVMQRGHTMYERSKGKASPQSYKRAKEMTKDPKWMLAGSHSGIHPVLLRGDDASRRRIQEQARQALLRTVQAFTPSETVFEVAGKGNTANAALMKERRKALERAAKRRVTAPIVDADVASDDEQPDEDQVAVVSNDNTHAFRDSEFYMSHFQKDASTEKGYSLRDGASFGEQARNATFDLAGDEGVAERKRSQLTWDKKKRRFIKGDGVGADNVKLVKTENGTRLPATYRSGRFDEWKAKTRMSLPRVGEAEHEGPSRRAGGSKRFRHNTTTEAKPLDKLDKNYDRKVRHLKKKNESAGGEGGSSQGRYRGKPVGRVKTELKTSEQIRKGRKMLEKRRAKNGRPSRKGKR
ncbi:ATP-dependent RNA helicase DBP10 [Mycena chlorophos]|uniref:RNA helicase n=1 Tax=Mycena chlorophos TaxID=658473 RepID=A0A8H6VQW2_MYCCL|nr:ATP-dependent RNA helicase DBP10 [Mycena chlorophos]